MKNRKDNKKRNLHQGEYQRSDGRYEFRYKDGNGVARSVYSKRLVDTDHGTDIPLRSLERDILKGEKVVCDKRTFDDAFNNYILSAPCKEHVRDLKRYYYELHIKTYFGLKDISKITNVDVQNYYRHLGIDLGYSSSYIEEMHCIINGVFKYEVSCKRLTFNPAENLGRTLKYLSTYKQNDRRAMNEDEQEAFIFAVEKSDVSDTIKRLIKFILGTGCRISEALSLRWEDVDFESGTISINHSFVMSGKYERYVSETKTEAGNREIPMLSSIRKLLSELSDEYEFIFVNPSGKPYTRGNIDIMLRRIRQNYNDGLYGTVKDVTELPPISAHILRHTFCTRLCENVTDMSGLKNVADIMGHSSVTTALNVYTSIDGKRRKEVMRQAEKKLLG